MNLRIQQFEPIWERIRIRLSSGVDTSDEMTREILSLVPPPLERQTNHLWTLSEEDREQWFNATSPEERDAILAIPPFVSILDPPLNRADFLTEANQIRYWAARTKQERDLIMAEEGFDLDM
jgi:hypothetical protein